jgi:hypothetical protein
MTTHAITGAIVDETFETLIPRLRPSEAIHPVSAQPLGHAKREVCKAELTVQDSYLEFAWEFMRRNRFYQALVDKNKKAVPESQWGYAWHATAPRVHGLVRFKPYWETYGEGSPPAWIGLDSFAERLPANVSIASKSVSVDLQAGQVAVVFDLAGLIHGQSPWDIQVWALRERLQELCQLHFKIDVVSGKPPHKKVLLRRLRMFDLLSNDTPLDKAALELKYRHRKQSIKAKSTASPFDPGHLQLGKSEPVTTAFEDASEAYNLVYRHGYIGLLRGEKNYTLQGQRLVPDSIVNSEDRDDAKDW